MSFVPRIPQLFEGKSDVFSNEFFHESEGVVCVETSIEVIQPLLCDWNSVRVPQVSVYERIQKLAHLRCFFLRSSHAAAGAAV